MQWVGMKEEVLSKGFEHFKETINRDWFWKNVEYSRNYKNLSEGIEQGDLMLLYFEDFREKPEEMIRKVCNFLEITTPELGSEQIKKTVNTTKDFAFPPAWREYTFDKLDNEIKSQKKQGIWHESWQDN
ncbi:hypothetical protein GCM10008940_00630 [Microbulbifer agarilyticus]